MVPLRPVEVIDDRFPDFPMLRIHAVVWFQPAEPDLQRLQTVFDGALVDTGAGYTALPYKFHSKGFIKIHQELGLRPYRIVSSDAPVVMQRFAEVGLRFAARQPDGSYQDWPEQFVRVKAYLLDADTKPKGTVLIGVNTLLEHFILHLEKGNSYLTAPNSDQAQAQAAEAGVSPPAGTDAAAPDHP